MSISQSSKDILDAWILVEHLSEGDLSRASEKEGLSRGNYYRTFEQLLSEAEPQSGLAIYCGIEPLGKVLERLRDRYKLQATDEDIDESSLRFMFSFGLDRKLSVIDGSEFYTAAGFILQNNELPDKKDFYKNFKKAEHQFKETLHKLLSPKEKLDEESFNQAFKTLLDTYNIDSKDCKFCSFTNFEAQYNSCHSFFIDDLERAKNSNQVNLELYLSGKVHKERVHLDPSKNPSVFEQILQPKNYPLGRFPSKTKYSLAFMQQVAVNLATGADKDNYLRSVNGPPGTGKTTLLKDIFATLIIEQAQHILALRTPAIPVDNETGIAVLPRSIAENNIVVASSNNTAVENIVSELPNLSEIDERFQEELLDVDYFQEAANALDNSSDSKTPQKWGLLSAPGGSRKNMSNLTNALKGALKSLDSYNAASLDSDIRESFQQQLKRVEELKEQAQTYFDHQQKFRKCESDPWPFKGPRLNQIQSKLDQLEHAVGDKLNLGIPREELQQASFWFDENFRIEQSKLFIEALRVRKAFLVQNREALETALTYWKKQNASTPNTAKQKKKIQYAWDWINFAVPIIGTTFASVRTFGKYLGLDSIGHLFIDEAGQATPQASVGAIMRSCHVMAVGDPAQIEPVLTLDENTLDFISECFEGIGPELLSHETSTQTLIDRVGQYGFYTRGEQVPNSWIGIPLWVHRRCLDPMFTISNKISYNGLMVQANTEESGNCCWYDVGGTAEDKYVSEQGDYLVKKIIELRDSGFDDEIYVISPFRKVRDKLEEKCRSAKSKLGNYQIGTVHAFQGKEASIVFLVLGADSKSRGAAAWAVSRANIMNVAATRAKKQFYIIGDKQLYSQLNSDVINMTISSIEDFNARKNAHTGGSDQDSISLRTFLTNLNIGLNSKEVQPVLLKHGLIERCNGGWRPTDKGESIGISTKLYKGKSPYPVYNKEAQEYLRIHLQDMLKNR